MLVLFHYFVKAVEYLPNKLIFFNSEIHYKEKNYLKVRTTFFKYITPPYSKGSVYQYISTLVYYISMFLYFYILSLTTWLSYPSSYSSTNSISSASCILTTTQYKSLFSTCTILLIRSVTAYTYFCNTAFTNALLKVAIKS